MNVLTAKVEEVKNTFHNLRYNLYSIGFFWKRLLFILINFKIIKKLFTREAVEGIVRKWRSRFLISAFFRDGKFDFNGVYLPDIRPYPNLMEGLHDAYINTFFVPCRHQDDHSAAVVDRVYPVDGSHNTTYIYHDDGKIDMMVYSGDIVVDAGAWIGGVSAYLASKGATVYAFEPGSTILPWLEETVRLNQDLPGKIIIVPQGLGEKKERLHFIDEQVSSMSSRFEEAAEGGETVEITTLDDFVRENNIRKIDFIKADVEGFERHLIKGAAWVLQHYQPKLSICTYHYPEDPELLESIIRSINPKYRVVHHGKLLYAFVEN